MTSVVPLGQKTPGAVGFAAPIYDRWENVYLYICLTIPQYRYQAAMEVAVARSVGDCASNVTAALRSVKPTKATTGQVVGK